ncbi:RagB/SusD family nutrient uptake outer membrane protein [Plebeiibacterium sediminum]|uniref:RagB/SusD family nutrient uptake outer membrane protein n=1 Tax=Plebeiibacterium sediminum TaxID=2992112 RepID=A0AAE3M6T2_9BACT|nr:RagB/SusD family nutrient uptake outer membrane protein [Plebeiobacterium sediminum]MCW3788168.1 RagB/SusD family nutrient uptake outer membrane protein [Plebeiobacterium sediminum]
MKNIIYTLSVLLLLAFISCNEDSFLEEMPEDNIYANNLFQDYDGFVNSMNAVYSWVREERSRADNIPLTRCTCWDTGVDNAFMNNGHSGMTFLNWPTHIYTDQFIFENMFDWLYRIINSTNMIINRAQKSDVNWMGSNDEENLNKKNYIIAQARLIRAWAYRHLTYCWGDVPLSLDEIDGSNYQNNWTRTPVADIQIQMEKDLVFAKENLPLRDDNPGNVNGAVAIHYLAELYLAMGRNAEAETTARELCEDSEYHLMTERFGSNANVSGVPYMDLFANPLPSQGNKEVLWALLNTEPEAVSYGNEDNNYMKNMWQTYYSKDNTIKKLDLEVFYSNNGGKGAGRSSITAPTFDLYEEQDDRISDFAIKWKLVMPNDQGEMEVVLETNTNHTITDGKYDLDHFQWPSTRKWEYVHPNTSNASSSDQFNCQMYIRLAETYLILAEALYKENKNDEAAIWINKVRERSNATPISGSDIDIDFILDERSRELVTEENRRHTLIRTDKLVERVQKYNDFAGPTIAQAPKYFPIPQKVIDANTGAVMKQNDGY